MTIQYDKIHEELETINKKIENIEKTIHPKLLTHKSWIEKIDITGDTILKLYVDIGTTSDEVAKEQIENIKTDFTNSLKTTFPDKRILPIIFAIRT